MTVKLQWVPSSPPQHPLVGTPHCADNSGYQRNFVRFFSLQKGTSQFEVCALSTFTPGFPSCYLSRNSKSKMTRNKTFVGLEIQRPVPSSLCSPNFTVCLGRSWSQHLQAVKQVPWMLEGAVWACFQQRLFVSSWVPGPCSLSPISFLHLLGPQMSFVRLFEDKAFYTQFPVLLCWVEH